MSNMKIQKLVNPQFLVEEERRALMAQKDSGAFSFQLHLDSHPVKSLISGGVLPPSDHPVMLARQSS